MTYHSSSSYWAVVGDASLVLIFSDFLRFSPIFSDFLWSSHVYTLTWFDSSKVHQLIRCVSFGSSSGRLVREVGIRCILVGDMSPWCGSGYSRVLLRIRTLVTLVTWIVISISTINLTTLVVLFDISLFICIYVSPSLPRLIGFYQVRYIMCRECMYILLRSDQSIYG